MLKRSFSWLLILTMVLPILTSCQDGGSPILKKKLTKISRDSSLSLETRNHAKALLELRAVADKALRDQPSLKAIPGVKENLSFEKATKLHAANTRALTPVLDAQQAAITKLVDYVKVLSKKKFSIGVAPAEVAETETLVYLNLLMVREFSQISAKKITFLMSKFDRSFFDELPENAEVKMKLLAEHTNSMSVAAVSGRDLKVTLKGLNSMRQDGILAASLEDSINDTVKANGKEEHKQKEVVGNFLKENLTEKAYSTMETAISDHQKNLKGKTFLYDPAMPDHPLIHVLVILSNLTWGLVNTLVGLGFVIAAAVLAPITTVTAAVIRAFGYEPLFYEIRFPRLKIADSNMQIYADVCGLGIVPGKMSAGLFELDFCAGKSFASDHEAGHAKQSAILGPLYFPAAILSYVLNMGHGGFIEEWADEWAVT